MRETIALTISDSSQVGEARRMAMTHASQLGFNETTRGKVGIIATELANNLIQHAKAGQILLRAIENPDHVGLEILSLDKGPGMANLGESLRDGFSTTGTSGTGLGAVKRLSSLFDIYSSPNQGTAILSRLWANESLATEEIDLGVICLPKAGETVSGDAWATRITAQHYQMLVADGLGHGQMAAVASLEAVRVFEEAYFSPKAMIEAAHGALRSTRGAALAIADIDLTQQLVRYAGIGNIAGSIFAADRSSSMVSHNGTVGHEVRKVQEFTYPWAPNGLLIMHSDGLSSQWRIERYPGLNYKHPSLIAGILYRDFYRERDDVTVLVAREGLEP